ncbi:hypothetical protein NKH18_39885 [Streptomyces sp. M10(2022)]
MATEDVDGPASPPPGPAPVSCSPNRTSPISPRCGPRRCAP